MLNKEEFFDKLYSRSINQIKKYELESSNFEDYEQEMFNRARVCAFFAIASTRDVDNMSMQDAYIEEMWLPAPQYVILSKSKTDSYIIELMTLAQKYASVDQNTNDCNKMLAMCGATKGTTTMLRSIENEMLQASIEGVELEDELKIMESAIQLSSRLEPLNNYCEGSINRTLDRYVNLDKLPSDPQ